MIGRFKTDREFALDVLGNVEERRKWQSFIGALDPPLHNFGASAATLAEHTGIVAERTLEEPYLRQYRDNVTKVFGKAPRSRFVQDLRNYMLHYALPVTGGFIRL